MPVPGYPYRPAPEAEAARLAAPRHVITLLSRPGCHLCDQARAVIAAVASDLGLPWTERDITQSPNDLRESQR